jgi:hypothetical protein
MTAENRARVKACMRLQREAGLAIGDAVTLHKSELTKEAAKMDGFMLPSCCDPSA